MSDTLGTSISSTTSKPPFAASRSSHLASRHNTASSVRVQPAWFTASFSAAAFFVIGFLLSGIVGVWASFDGLGALLIYLQLFAGALPLLLLPLLFPNVAPLRMGLIAAWMALLGLVMLALVYLPAKLGALLPAEVLRLVAVVTVSDNLAGSVAATLLPVVLASLFISLQKRLWLLLLVALLATIAGGAMLYFSGSRGGMIGLAVGAGMALYLLWRLHGARASLPMRILDIVLALLAVALFAIYLATVFLPANQGGNLLTPIFESRVTLWHDVLPMLQDYYYTGAGLGVTPAVLSAYAFLVHVPYLFHAHNLYLQIMLDQGVFGLFSFVGLILSSLIAAISVWRLADATIRVLLAGWVGAVIAMSIHGLFDAELYFGAVRFLPIFCATFLLLLAWLVARSGALAGRTRYRAIGVLAALLIFCIPLALPEQVSRLYSNYAAVLQTREQLSRYVQGEWMAQDSVLQAEPERFAEAVAFYTRALEGNPNNASANRRLAQIEVAQGDYESAFDHLQAATASPISSRMTLQYLGELYALRGNPQQTALIWQMLDNTQDQLETRRWWYEYAVDDPQLLARYAAALDAYKDSIQATSNE